MEELEYENNHNNSQIILSFKIREYCICFSIILIILIILIIIILVVIGTFLSVFVNPNFYLMYVLPPFVGLAVLFFIALLLGECIKAYD